MNTNIKEEFIRCATCSNTRVYPSGVLVFADKLFAAHDDVGEHAWRVPCERCQPREYVRLFQALDEVAIPALPINRDPVHRFEVFFMTGEGVLFAVDYAHDRYLREDGQREHHEKLVAELQRLKDENREVLAENARLRRTAEKKR